MNFEDLIVDFGTDDGNANKWDKKRKQKIRKIGDYRKIKVKIEEEEEKKRMQKMSQNKK